MKIRATKPANIDHALGLIIDHLNDIDNDASHLTASDVEEINREFSMAVHYIARENLIHPKRNYCLWLADKLFHDFPFLGNYDANGNWCGAVANENGWTA